MAPCPARRFTRLIGVCFVEILDVTGVRISPIVTTVEDGADGTRRRLV